MKPPVETIRISALGRDQLTKLKRQTGIEHWNVLCRWAFCTSLRERSQPPNLSSLSSDGGVEISWKAFAGEYSEVFSCLLAVRARKDGLGQTSDTVAQCLRLHLHRGLGYLSSGKDVKTIDGFMRRWVDGVR